ncbi:MAG: hypothetical protein ACP5NV_02620 [Candidatus Woesearchaeota archaeon]
MNHIIQSKKAMEMTMLIGIIIGTLVLFAIIILITTGVMPNIFTILGLD